MELCQPQDPVPILAVPGPCVTHPACAKDARKAEAREGGLAGCCGESWKGRGDACSTAGGGREHLPVVSRQEGVSGSVCVWV